MLAVILHVLPYQERGPSGFIYLPVDELKDQAAFIAYIDNARRGVTVLPCQNFDEFIVLNSLHTCQVFFIIDLPDYIVTMGRCILEEGAHSDEEVGPDLSRLPRYSFDFITVPAVWGTCPSSLLAQLCYGTGVKIRAPRNTSSCPDLDGFKSPHVPILFLMGGPTSVGNFSLLTTSNTHSLQGGFTQRSYILTQRS